MSDSTRLRWRFIRTRTTEGEKYFWELVKPDGTVVERMAADIAPAAKPVSAPGKEVPQPSRKLEK